MQQMAHTLAYITVNRPIDVAYWCSKGLLLWTWLAAKSAMCWLLAIF